jgi:restriction system protein
MDKAKKGRYFDLDVLDGYEFEEFVARLLRKMGYENVKVTQRSGDKGKDILATSNSGKNHKYPVVVECKHQKSVGRPVIQKLQGALLHEIDDHPFIKGIVVISGKFTKEAIEYTKEINNKHSDWMEIELMDGHKLKELCKEHGIKVINGKIHITSNLTFKHLPKEQIKQYVFNDLNSIVGIEKTAYQIKTWKTYHPYYCITYNINSEIHTKVGCIYKVKEANKTIVVDGITGKIYECIPNNFFKLDSLNELVSENELNLLKPFNYSTDEIEQNALDTIIKNYTKEVTYKGKNNVEYTKICSPNKKDILIKESYAIYAPAYTNSIKIQDMLYNQNIIANDKDILKLSDDLRICKVCGKDIPKDKYVCPVCGKILCQDHTIFDHLDNSPICSEHAIPMKLYLQTIHFSSVGNYNNFKDIWASMTTFQKIMADGYVSKIIVLLGIVLLIYLVKYIFY